ncbi:MAG: hypothetical protein ACE5K8_03325 [Candidatus Zixiibacteriota bacterium]
MKKFLALLIVLALAVSASAQSSDAAKLNAISRSSSLGIRPVPSPFSLLDLSKMHWTHSYSLSLSFFSGSGYSGSVGILRSSMLYDLSSQFTLGLNLGIVHNAGALWGDETINASFLPGFWLDYHPSRRFNMSINVQWYQGGYYPFMNRSHYWPGYLSRY